MLKNKVRGILYGLIIQALACLLPGNSILQISFAQENRTHSEQKDNSAYAMELVRAIPQAHGGWENWVGAPAMKFSSEEYRFLTPSSQTERFEFVDVYYYRVSITPARSTGYAYFSEDASIRVSFDGDDIRTIGLTDENNNLNKSPAILLFSAYSLISLPWLSQMDQVNLEYRGTGSLPLEREHHEIVRITFESERENPHEGYYELYIDPETKLLRGVRQATVLPKLPGTEFHLGVPSLPVPILHVFKTYEVVDGLVIPSSFASYLQGKLLGISFIKEISLSEALESTLILPYNEKVLARDTKY